MPDDSDPKAPPTDRRLSELGDGVKAAQDRLSAAARAQTAQAQRVEDARAAGAAWRIMIDFVVATALGAGIGYGIDVWIGSAPWFLALGMAAGFGTGLWMAMQWSIRLQRGSAPPVEEEKK